jgi:integrase
VPVLDDFQDYLINDKIAGGKTVKGIQAQTANDHKAAINKAFNYLVRKGIIDINPCRNLIPLPENNKKSHGCYELEKMKGIFNKRWKDRMAYLLNLIIYTTDMRPVEIKGFCKNDIVSYYGCHFIDLKKSKTENGIRHVPLHEKTHKKIMEYVEGKDSSQNIFGDVSAYQFSKAYKELGKMLGFNRDFLKEKNIKFYSGRHFWKTLMSAHGLGEGIEECFMGHRVTNDVAKLYNHRDMQGRKNLAKKAKEVFKILDTWLFVQRKK